MKSESLSIVALLDCYPLSFRLPSQIGSVTEFEAVFGDFNASSSQLADFDASALPWMIVISLLIWFAVCELVSTKLWQPWLQQSRPCG